MQHNCILTGVCLDSKRHCINHEYYLSLALHKKSTDYLQNALSE